MQSDLWTYPADSSAETLDRFEVEATDGDIGKVDEATYEVGSSYIVVDTGPWILGRKVLLPAGVIERIDLDNRKVQVRLTKDQIKNSPETRRTSVRSRTASASAVTTRPTTARAVGASRPAERGAQLSVRPSSRRLTTKTKRTEGQVHVNEDELLGRLQAIRAEIERSIEDEDGDRGSTLAVIRDMADPNQPFLPL